MKRLLLSLIALVAFAGTAHAQDPGLYPWLKRSGGNMSGAIGLAPFANGSEPVTCDSTAAGKIIYSTTSTAPRYCNGSAWGQISTSSLAFSAITGGTNAAALIVGTGGSLTVSGSGTINATTLNSATFAAPGAIGGGTPGTGAFTTLTASGAFTQTTTAIATAQTVGGTLTNTTAAAAGAQQYSPVLELTGQGWKTDATAASQTVKWGFQTRPVQGAAAPTSVLDFLSSINGGAYAAKFSVSSAGDATLQDNAGFKNVGGAYLFQVTSGNIVTVGPGGYSTLVMAYNAAPTFNGGLYLTQTLFGNPSVAAIDASTERPDIKFDLSTNDRIWSAGALTTQRFLRVVRPTVRFGGASVCTTCSLASFEGPPSAGTNATITNAINLLAGGASTQVSASGLTINQINVPAATTTITGSTQVTAASGAVHIGIQTLSAASAMTWDAYAGIYVAGPPVGAGAGPLTLTSGYSIWSDAGPNRFDGRVLESQGADVASATNVTLGADGNTFEITGTTAVDCIVGTGWQNGSTVTLVFTSTVAVSDAATCAGANVAINIGAAFTSSAEDTLTLVLSEMGGTQQWREVARSVN